MKKRVKDNNMGFSLVELIVVVLIMAIIAVALAPQILKWVNNSRISTDMQTKDSLVDLMQMTVLTDEAVNAIAIAEGVDLVVNNSGTTINPKQAPAEGTSQFTALINKFCEYAGVSDFEEFNAHTKTKTKNGVITVSVSADAATISSELKIDGSTVEKVED